MAFKTIKQATAVAVAENESARLARLAKQAPPITTNPERLSGAPVIGIERLPVTTLLDYLLDGYTVERFCAQFDCDVQAFFEPSGCGTRSGLVFCPNVNGPFGVQDMSSRLAGELQRPVRMYAGGQPKNWNENVS